MKAPEERLVLILGHKVPVPEGAEPAAVKRAAQSVEQRLGAIQQASLKMNTYTFALQLALELTLDLQTQDTAHKSDIHDVLRQLSKLNETIEQTLESLPAGGRP
jgi:cell division protein ZapA (FtsZ GTPase activity inhibitor)